MPFTLDLVAQKKTLMQESIRTLQEQLSTAEQQANETRKAIVLHTGALQMLEMLEKESAPAAETAPDA
jgi:hypothetical protein